jgi:hypothetical protein
MMLDADRLLEVADMFKAAATRKAERVLAPA